MDPSPPESGAEFEVALACSSCLHRILLDEVFCPTCRSDDRESEFEVVMVCTRCTTQVFKREEYCPTCASADVVVVNQWVHVDATTENALGHLQAAQNPFSELTDALEAINIKMEAVAGQLAETDTTTENALGHLQAVQNRFGEVTDAVEAMAVKMESVAGQPAETDTTTENALGHFQDIQNRFGEVTDAVEAMAVKMESVAGQLAETDTTTGATCSVPDCDQPPTWGQIESGVWTRLCAVHLHTDLELLHLGLDPATSEASSGATCSWPGCDELATCATGGMWRCGVHEELYLRNLRLRGSTASDEPASEVSSAPTPDEGETSSGSKRLTARWMAWTEGVAERNRDFPERHRDSLDRNYLEGRQVNTEGLSRVELRETVRREKILEREEREQQQDERDREYLERKLNLMVKSGVVSADEIEDELGVDGIEGLSRVTLRELTNLLRQEQRAEFWTAVGQGVVTMAASANTESNWQRNFNPKPTPESHPPGAGHRQAAFQASQNANQSDRTGGQCDMQGCTNPGEIRFHGDNWYCGIHIREINR